MVPAHDEAAGIAATINSLAAVDWPAEAIRILVLADNCSDDTAARARAASARVIERDDPAHRGKGYALALAFTTLINEGWSEAVIVVEAARADTPAKPAMPTRSIRRCPNRSPR